MKNILAVILAGFVVMFIMISTPEGTEPLKPDGNYTYPEYCIGHESDFVVDKSANSYINHGNVSDAITYVGTQAVGERVHLRVVALCYCALAVRARGCHCDTSECYNSCENLFHLS
jgi:hypothetical protein